MTDHLMRAVNCKTFENIGIGLVSRDFKGLSSPLRLCGMGDIHGSARAVKLVLEELKKVREGNGRVVMTGDLIDNRTKGSKSFYHGGEAPMGEIDRIGELFEEYKDHIDAVVGGNHCHRTWKETGEDPLRRMCMTHKIPYHPDAMVVVYRVGKQKCTPRNKGQYPNVYTVFLSHGSRSGRKEGTKLQKVIDYREVINADIMLSGHSHDLTGHRGSWVDIEKASDTLLLHDKVYLNCGSYQNYIGYPVEKNMSPAPMGCVWVTLGHHERMIKFEL